MDYKIITIILLLTSSLAFGQKIIEKINLVSTTESVEINCFNA